jgi:NAD(P)-dependent dehydrogenase (short-subunit alcohol dehydrogenase family)
MGVSSPRAGIPRRQLRAHAIFGLSGLRTTSGARQRRKTFMEKWAPAHGMSVEEATKTFPAEAGISRYGKPEEIADLMAFLVSPAAKWLTGTSVRMDGGEVKGI